jgi:hypothetical protein
MNNSVIRERNLNVEYPFRPVRVARPHVLEPIFDETYWAAQSASEVRNEHRMFDATLDPVASANVHVLVNADAI